MNQLTLQEYLNANCSNPMTLKVLNIFYNALLIVGFAAIVIMAIKVLGDNYDD